MKLAQLTGQPMVSIEKWLQWIAFQILSTMSSPPSILESTLRARAGHQIDSNFDLALRRFVDTGLFTLSESNHQRTYEVPDEVAKLQKVVDLANSTPGTTLSSSPPQIAQGYSPDPEGFDFWFSPPDNPNRSRKKSVYIFYRGKKDLNDYYVVIRSKSSSDPDPYKLGSMHDPKSWIARGWEIFNELAGKSEDGTVSLIQLLTRDSSVFETGTKRRGKIMLAIWEQEGWIVKADKSGNEVLYRLSAVPPPETKRETNPIMDYFKEEPKKPQDTDFEAWTDLDRSEISTKGKKSDKPPNDNKG
jgi:hypothetical protein